jgi:hypothetical protein
MNVDKNNAIYSFIYALLQAFGFFMGFYGFIWVLMEFYGKKMESQGFFKKIINKFPKLNLGIFIFF